ncbi:MAG: hypothetical protein JKY65_30465 [Planctomycetes bacterium]|nr:hypothetical protein [Planctomycetota bacterium]
MSPRLIVVTLALACPALAQETPRSKAAAPRALLSAEKLAPISARGRQIAEYDQACWLGTDALFAAGKIKQELVSGFFARKEEAGWRVVFGKLNKKGDSYQIAYEAIQSGPKKYSVRRHEGKPLADTGFFLQAAGSLRLALASFKATPQRRHNYAVLPASKGQLWVL